MIMQIEEEKRELGVGDIVFREFKSSQKKKTGRDYIYKIRKKKRQKIRINSTQSARPLNDYKI